MFIYLFCINKIVSHAFLADQLVRAQQNKRSAVVANRNEMKKNTDKNLPSLWLLSVCRRCLKLENQRYKAGVPLLLASRNLGEFIGIGTLL